MIYYLLLNYKPLLLRIKTKVTKSSSTCFPQWDTQFLAFVAVSDYVIQFLLFIIHAQECGLGVS